MRQVVALALFRGALGLADLVGDDPRILPTALELQGEETAEIERASGRR